MDKEDLLKIIPKYLLRQILVCLIMALFILMDIYFLHNEVFKIYNQYYLIGFCIYISITYYILNSINFILINVLKKGNGVDSYTEDIFSFIGGILVFSLIISLDYFYSIRIRYIAYLLISYPLLRITIKVLFNVTRALSVLKSLLQLILK
jgi:hypothetical protein